ncbi:IclR family transcriptional regulator [Paracoccus contaminans]|uniref:IclR family transcriptional regulator n=1 Tax=Paracoccus contaminans TaxID=1945662 RepID=A0A1W6CY13_9RHOB|nr:helix-turn-helix domain-containing protein [Paracoccus contaminans]ARJ69736.1 IclR family transcriptional regulator [Paracoccus contaminans]
MDPNEDNQMHVSNDRYRAPALDRGLDILELLASRPDGLTRAEIGKALGFGPSQIYRVLERLAARRYIARLDGGDRYALSMKLFALGSRHPALRRLAVEAQPLMDRFALDQRQSCHLVVPEEGAGLVVAQAGPLAHWEFRARVGARLDLLETGSGLTLLAFQHPETRAATLKSWGCSGLLARIGEAEPEMERIRTAGLRVAPSAQVVGITDISLPVLGADGSAVAVLTCPCVTHPDTPSEVAIATATTGLKIVVSALNLGN